MKKILALILSFAIMTGGIIAVSANTAESMYPKELSGGFKGVKESTGVGYVYHSPVKDENDTTKYPLFIYMPGIGESSSLEKALYGGIGNLTAEKYQNNVAGVKGAYIMQMVGSNLKSAYSNHAAIKKFVDSNPNVDKSRIYVSGWCMGVQFAVSLVTSYSDYYAGLCIYSPFAVILPGSLSNLSNTRVWIFGCKTDLLCIYPLTLMAYVSALSAARNAKNVRLTTCDIAPAKGPGISHFIWKLIYGDGDAESREGIIGLDTHDGTGTKAELTSILGWMSEWTIYGDYVAPSEPYNDDNDDLPIDENETELQMADLPVAVAQ